MTVTRYERISFSSNLYKIIMEDILGKFVISEYYQYINGIRYIYNTYIIYKEFYNKLIIRTLE